MVEILLALAVLMAPPDNPSPFDGPPAADLTQEGGEPSTLQVAIEGPTQVEVGDLVVLKGTATEGAKFKWLYYEGYKFPIERFDLETNLVFAGPRRTGKYLFWLIAANEKAEIVVASHMLTVGTVTEAPLPTPTGDPTNPLAPREVLPPSGATFPAQSIYTLATDWAAALADGPTALMVADELKKASPKIRAATGIPAANEVVEEAIATALNSPKRTEFSRRYKLWEEGFSGPLSDYCETMVEAGSIRTMADLDAVIQSAAEALAESAR